MSDDIVKTLERLAFMAEVANHHIQDTRVMPAAGVADILYEAIDRIEALKRTLDEWKFFAEAAIKDDASKNIYKLSICRANTKQN